MVILQCLCIDVLILCNHLNVLNSPDLTLRQCCYLLCNCFDLSEGDTPSLRAETQDYLPLQIARAKAHAKMKATRQSLEEVRETLHREKLEHRDLIYDLKTEIKTTRANINAMENGSYGPAVEFMAKLLERRESQTSELDNKRMMLDDEIGMYSIIATVVPIFHQPIALIVKSNVLFYFRATTNKHRQGYLGTRCQCFCPTS